MYFYSNTYYNHDRLKSNFMGQKKLYRTPDELRKRSRAYYKKWYGLNREKQIATSKSYCLANKDKRKATSKAYYENNKDKIKATRKVYLANNVDKIKARHKAYRAANLDKLNAYSNNRLKTNIQFKLSLTLRSRLHSALKSNQKTGSAVKDLGCTINEFKIYLESKFQFGMTWDNWTTDGWHIDHIKPLASFDLTDRKQLLEACHYTNLQPLWATDNLIKSDKLV